MKLLCILRTALIASLFCAVALGAGTSVGSFVVTNNDTAPPPLTRGFLPPPFSSTVTFFNVNANGTLSGKALVETGGLGIEGGFFAASRVIAMSNGSDACVYASNAGSGSIAGIDAGTHTLSGDFFGSAGDAGTSNGIGLAANAQYLYATYTDSTTIGTFQVQAGCTLSFVGDVFAAGLNGGVVGGMAISGNMMVVTFGDGSIESFNISSGMPVSNNDEQYSTGSNNDNLPNGVVITHDGHYAIFGDASTTTNVEISDISSGKLAATIAYSLGPAWNSGNVRLTPDETALFVTNNSSGQVTAAFFNSTTGQVYPGCTSNTLSGFYSNFQYAGNIALQLPTGTGGLLYVPEAGFNSAIGILQFTPGSGAVNSAPCTLKESANSPVNNSIGTTMLSIAAYPAAQ